VAADASREGGLSVHLATNVAIVRLESATASWNVCVAPSWTVAVFVTEPSDSGKLRWYLCVVTVAAAGFSSMVARPRPQR